MKKEFRSKKDIIETFYKIDFELGQIPIIGKVSLTIFGGSALLLKSDLHVTSDIDAFIRMENEDRRVRQVLAKYSVSGNVEGALELPPIEEIPLVKLNVEFDNLVVFLPQTEHLILSKIFVTRQTTKDVDDIIKSGILDYADIEKLKWMYDDYVGYLTLQESRYNTLKEVLEAWEKIKRKE